MLTPASRKYLLKLLKVAHLTYQSPLVWNSKTDAFLLDTTRRYQVLSQLVLLIDCSTFVTALVMITVNYSAGLNRSFTLLLLFCLIWTVVNVITDVNNLTTPHELLQFLNTIWRMVQSPQGKTKLARHYLCNITFTFSAFCTFSISGNWYYTRLTLERRQLNHAMIIAIYVFAIVIGTGYTVAVPIIFLDDSFALLKELYRYFEAFFNVTFVSYLPPKLCLLVFMQIGCAITMFMVMLKWVKYPVQLLPAVYYCANLLSRRNSGIRGTAFSISAYKAVYVFIGLFNEVFSMPLISIKCLMIMFPSIGIAMCIVEKPSLMYFPLITESLMMILFANVYFNFASTIFKYSSDYISQLKAISHMLPGRGGKTMNRKVASLRTCRIYCGSLYFVDRRVVLKVNDAVLNLTINTIMLIKK